MSHDSSSKKWYFFASGQSIGKRSSVSETRRPGLLPSINNSRNLALLKNKKAKNRYDIFHVLLCSSQLPYSVSFRRDLFRIMFRWSLWAFWYQIWIFPMPNNENRIFRNYRMRTFRNRRNKWSDRVLTVRFVISVVENPRGWKISSKLEGRLFGYHPILDSYEERVIWS